MLQDRELPNPALRVLLLSVEQVMGADGMEAMLNAADLSQYLGNDLPNNPEHRATFSQYGRIEQAVEDFYGPRGARAILLRVGYSFFQNGMKEQPAALERGGQALKSIPFVSTQSKMRLLLRQMVVAANEMLNQPARLEEDADGFMIVMEQCMCEYRPRHQLPCCLVAVGTFAEGIKWLTGKPFEVQEITCLNLGADACRYRLAKQAME